MITNAPCYGCSDRCMLCHSHCEKYATWFEMMRKGKKRPLADIEAEAVAIDRKRRIRQVQQERWQERNKR